MKGATDSTGTRALGNAFAALLDAPIQLATALSGGLAQRLAQGCEIPPPCWEPRPLGTCTVELPAGSAATIRVHVTNCGWSRQVVGITAAGPLAGIVKFEPTTLIVDPQSQATITVTVQLPAEVKPGATFSGPLLVRGCVDHFARVHVRAAECVAGSCCDIFVQDCADQIHHWYDHFYCPRPCRGSSRTAVVTNG